MAAVAALPAPGAGQATDEVLIAGAVEALPEAFRDGAEVRAWDGEWTLRTIREGSNGFICLADKPSDERFQTTCYFESLEPFLAAGRRLRSEGLSGMEYQEARWAAIERGEIEMPSLPAALYNFFHEDPGFDPMTDDPATGGRLHTLYQPGMTPENTGIPLEAPAGQPWIMWPGKPSSHVMIAMPPGGS